MSESVNRTLNNLIEEFDSMCSAHVMVKSFFYGDFNRIISSHKIKHTAILMNTADGAIDENFMNFRLEVACADKVFNDESNLNEVESDTVQILQDIFGVMTYSTRWQSFCKITGSSPVRKFIAKGEDMVTGWSMTMNIAIKRKNGICNIPIEDYDYQGEYKAYCAGVRIYEDGILVDIVASGDRYDYTTSQTPINVYVNGILFYDSIIVDQNINIVNTANTQTGSKIGSNWVIGDSEIEILNSDASYDQLVSIAAENSAVHPLPDVNMTKPNGDIETWPSVKNYVCTQIAALLSSDLISQLTDAQVKAIYDGRININVIELTTIGAQTYTKPANLLFADVICIGGGGGGASGQRKAGPTASQGGGGGGAGAIARRRLLESQIAATETVTVGNGGAGGGAQTVDGGSQNGGTAGGSTSFGTLVVAVGGSPGANATNGAGAITVRTSNTPQTSQLNIQGGPASAGGTIGAGAAGQSMSTSSSLLHYGGAGGGALSAATPGTENAGGNGSRIYDASGTLNSPSLAGVAGGGNGNPGVDNWAKQFQIYDSILHTLGLGSSGAGGGSENAGVAGSGGNGGLYGAGGGGGGGSRNGFNSGAGGNGAQGLVVIYEYLV